MSVAQAKTIVVRKPSPAPFAGEDLSFKIRDGVSPTALILDLGGVFCNFSVTPDAPIKPKEFKYILESPEWHTLELGKGTPSEVYKVLAERFAVTEDALQETVRQVSSTLTLNDDFVAAIRRLRLDSGGHLRVFAATNMSKASYDIVRAKLGGWDIFDDVFTSASLGVRKPEREFFDRVLEAAGVDAQSAVFFDDRTENVICAQCCEMKGVLFSDTESAIQMLHALFSDPVERGKSSLLAHAKNMWYVSSTGVEIRDQFQQLLLLHLTNDWDLVRIGQTSPETGHWNVFAYGAPVLTTDTYPDDLDTTSLALLTLDATDRIKENAMDDMLKFMNPDGLAYCYFDPSRPRIDPFISANVLRLFYANKRGWQLQHTRRFMEDMLRTGAFEHGTRYYHLPDFFLYYLSDLCAKHSRDDELDTLRDLIVWRLQERIGATHDAPSAALRVIAARNMQLSNNMDRKVLLDLQHSDGRWTGYVYRYGSTGILFSSEGLVTALAVAALRGN
ncbi:hypothetical protein GQ607_013444 [Colletotrichum asianum]|uniref:HAD-like protein n=1 Tax=Colletotrichum asianum TaxID=702518 RepID=A0A8H3W2I9_9PEZI|nr:hypothetical protein GQ607_013444 [Colletotrichum asianum]